MQTRTVLILSGGMDSAVLLYDLLRSSRSPVEALTFDYGQRHRREIESAKALTLATGTPHVILKVPVGVVAPGSSQTNPDIAVPYGHYTDESMKQTVVPNRNMIMLSFAIARAITVGADSVAYAAHHGDHAIYPDCRPEFVQALSLAAQLADWHRVDIYAPYLGKEKSEIVQRGLDLGVPFQFTYSCYEGREAHCGKCGTCYERREAFAKNNATDPTEYAEECSPALVD